MYERAAQGGRTLRVSVALILAGLGLLLAFTGEAGEVTAGVKTPTRVLGAVEAPPVESMMASPAAVAVNPPVVATTVAAPGVTPTGVVAGDTDVTAEALALISYDWRARFPQWTLGFEGPRTGVRGMTLPGEQRVQIFVRDADDARSLARVIAHELGHVADIELNDSADRLVWREVRGIDVGVPWWPDGTSFDFDTVAGDFAESFAVWQAGSTMQSRVAPAPDADQLAVLAELTS